jgi:hypothetical protein
MPPWYGTDALSSSLLWPAPLVCGELLERAAAASWWF